MKNQALFSSKDKSKKLKCRLLQFLFLIIMKADENETKIFRFPSIIFFRQDVHLL